MRLTFGFLLLAISVFAWGLTYKLSLYDPPDAITHSMPEAKLLSNRERAGYLLPAFASDAVSPGITLRRARAALLLVFAWTLCALPDPRVFFRWISPCYRGRSKAGTRELTLEPFSLRPPPSLS